MEMNKKVGILLTGGMCSGKSYAADVLKNHIKGSEIFSFAASLKKMVGDHYARRAAFSKEGTYPVYNKKDGQWTLVSGRNILQRISEAIKTVDYSWFYVDTYKTICDSSARYFIIDDCRFEEEYLFMKSKFKKIILVHLDPSEELRQERCKDLYKSSIDKKHVSERLTWVKNYADLSLVDADLEEGLLEFIKNNV